MLYNAVSSCVMWGPYFYPWLKITYSKTFFLLFKMFALENLDKKWHFSKKCIFPRKKLSTSPTKGVFEEISASCVHFWTFFGSIFFLSSFFNIFFLSRRGHEFIHPPKNYLLKNFFFFFTYFLNYFPKIVWIKVRPPHYSI